MVYFYFLFSLLLFFVFIFLFFVVTYSFFFSGYLKSSAFECGFQPFSEVGLSFSMPFFVVSLLFLLFDVEIILLCFFPISSVFCFSFFIYWWVLVFVLFLTFYEWLKGGFSWV